MVLLVGSALVPVNNPEQIVRERLSKLHFWLVLVG